MNKSLTLVIGFLLTTPLWARSVQVINALGASPKGQYVAIEEYGYNSGQKTYYSRIKFMNVWKNQYVAPPVEIEEGAVRPSDLARVRDAAKAQASQVLEKLKINTST